MLTDIIPAYLYQQYANDDDLQVFVAAYNSAVQYYVDWFSSTALGYYPGLTGGLLDWVAEGLYGISRTSLQSTNSTATGPLNTIVLDAATMPLNSYVFPTTTIYSLTDDLFQRIITWNFFKGDGKRFSMSWLKRRIMRFILGVDGVNPNPADDDFTVGPENTMAISAQVSSHVLTVSINQVLLSSYTQLTPGILTIFQLAFESGVNGVLDLPAQYESFVCNIETNLTVVITPTSVSVTGSNSSETTPTATAVAFAGSGSYTYAWTWGSGGTGITIAAPSSNATDFSATGLSAGETLSGTALCTVTDTITSDTASSSLSVSIMRVSLPSASADPSSLSQFGNSSSLTTAATIVTVTGGQSPYTYDWSWQSGGSDIIINSNTSSSTTFTGQNLSPSQTESGVALCTVTDFYGQQTTCTVSVSITRAMQLTVAVSPTSLSVTGATSSETTAATTATPSGGISPYSYSWTWSSGGAGITPNSPTGQSTTFTGSGLSPGSSESGTALCTVNDQSGQNATATCAVSINRVTQVSAVVSPTSQTSTGTGTTQTTGTSTVTASGGSGSYSYAWVWSSGGTNLTINDPNSAATNFTGSSLGNNTYTGVALCTITDGYGQTAQVTVSVSITCTLVGSAVIKPANIPGGTDQELYGYQQSNFGTLVSSSIPAGTLNSAYTLLTEGSGSGTLFAISASSNPGEDYFATLSTSFGSLSVSAAASYSYSGGLAIWQWTSNFWENATMGDEYTITFSSE